METKYYVVQDDIILHTGTFESCEKAESYLRRNENGYITIGDECIPLDSDKLEVISCEDFDKP